MNFTVAFINIVDIIDHNAYISDKFIQAMRNNSEKAWSFGSG